MCRGPHGQALPQAAAECHGMTSLPLPCPPLATSEPFCLHSASSASTLPLLPPLHSHSEACLCNLCNCIMPTLGLTADHHHTHSDLAPMPAAADCIPLLHLTYLPQPYSLP